MASISSPTTGKKNLAIILHRDAAQQVVAPTEDMSKDPLLNMQCMQLRVFALMVSQHTLSALMHFEMRIFQCEKEKKAILNHSDRPCQPSGGRYSGHCILVPRSLKRRCCCGVL
jgi:hypothetical protein